MARVTQHMGRVSRDAAAALWTLAGIVLLGLVLRLWWIGEYDLWRRTGPEKLTGDEPGYNNLALALLHGEGFDCACRVPGYPLFLAGVHWMTHESYTGIADIQTLVGLTIVPLTYVLATRFFGRVASLVAAFLAAVSYSLIVIGFPLLTEVVYTPILLLAAIALVDAVRRPTVLRLVLAGALVGGSALVRPTLFLFPLFAFLLFVMALGRRPGLRAGAVFALAAVVVMAPWIVRGYARYHAVFPLATSYALAWQGSPEYYHLVRDRNYSYLDVWTKVIYGPAGQRHDPGTVEGDRYWTRRALSSIADEPTIYARYAAEKLGTFWIGDPEADWFGSHPYDYRALRDGGWTRRDAILLMLDRIVPLVALGALFVLRRRWRTLLPLLALPAYATLVHAATHAEARLSDPFRPFLLILVAGALVALVEGAMERFRSRETDADGAAVAATDPMAGDARRP
jgi:4-amino-4-deoxy-L-arabinose transferase-like glycosyltransferase